MPAANKKQSNQHATPGTPARGGTLLGVLLGLGLGLLIASVVAYFVYQKGTPFKTLDNPNPPTVAAPLKTPEPTAAAKTSVEGKITPAMTPPPVSASASSSAAPTKAPLIAETAPQVTPSAPPVAKESSKESPKEKTKAAAQKEEPATGNEGGKPLFLQAGAFTNKADAESRKAALAMVGLEARITEITKDDKPVYRVRVGPFESPESATKARGDMARNGIDSVLVK
jgi:cell division protein FtsN